MLIAAVHFVQRQLLVAAAARVSTSMCGTWPLPTGGLADEEEDEEEDEALPELSGPLEKEEDAVPELLLLEVARFEEDVEFPSTGSSPSGASASGASASFSAIVINGNVSYSGEYK